MLSSHAMDTIYREVERTKERRVGKMVIAVRMVRRHATLIAEEEVRARPLLRRGRGLGGQSAVYLLGSPASGQCDKESASLVDRLLSQVPCQGGGLCGPFRDIVQDMHFGMRRHRMNLLFVRWSIMVREDSAEAGGFSGRTFAALLLGRGLIKRKPGYFGGEEVRRTRKGIPSVTVHASDWA